MCNFTHCAEVYSSELSMLFTMTEFFFKQVNFLSIVFKSMSESLFSHLFRMIVCITGTCYQTERNSVLSWDRN